MSGSLLYEDNRFYRLKMAREIAPIIAIPHVEMNLSGSGHWRELLESTECRKHESGAYERVESSVYQSA